MSNTPIKRAVRPLSPHLQVYRLPLTAVTSITHRITGVGLALGSILVASYLIAAASGEEAYNMVMAIATSGFGQIILFLWSAALYYHMCNGIRHLLWDTGLFFKKEEAARTSQTVIICAAILTLATWACAFLTN